MPDDVVNQIRSVKRPQDDAMVEALERLLAAAESGELNGVVVVARYPDRTDTEVWGSIDRRDLALAAIELQATVIDGEQGDGW